MDPDERDDLPIPIPAVTPGTAPPLPAGDGARVALLGLGTVGSAVARRLCDPAWGAYVASRGHRPPRLAAVGVREPGRERAVELPPGVRLTDDLGSLVAADDVDVVVELIGGVDPAGELVAAALSAGRPVVTANKVLLARHGRELEAAARDAGVALRFEAAVAGGVPLLGPLVRHLAANQALSLRGIVNGTTNYILSRMASEAREYGDVLREAQARGYAEADPRSDVDGHDAASKLAILVRLAFGGWPDVGGLRREVPTLGLAAAAGISGITRAQLSTAARLGLCLKLVARAERGPDGTIRAAATPAAVAAGSPLGATGDVTNLVDLTAEPVGRVTFRGPGAGGDATASSVLADLLAIEAGAGATWERLPPPVDLTVEDDLGLERGWLVTLDGLGEAGFPESLRQLSLASTDGGFVSRPMAADALTTRLALLDRIGALFPVLPDA